MSATPEDHFAARRYTMRHRTAYTYDEDVTTCYERGFLRPRPTPTQTIVSNDISVSPEPDIIAEHVDFFGNQSYYLEFRTPHTLLDIVQTSVFEIEWPRVDLEELNRWTVAEAVAELADADDIDEVERVGYLLESSLVQIDENIREYAANILAPDRPLGEAIMALVTEIFHGFTYSKGATSTKTTLAELLELKAGVCQDFAHLAVGCFRAVGLPARYVSGYIETQPPPGKVKLQGSDATHAWAGVMVPGGGWVDLDPTNNHLADSRYLVTGWGRDFRDVSPLKGIIFTEAGNSELKVEVDVIRQAENSDAPVDQQR